MKFKVKNCNGALTSKFISVFLCWFDTSLQRQNHLKSFSMGYMASFQVWNWLKKIFLIQAIPSSRSLCWLAQSHRQSEVCLRGQRLRGETECPGPINQTYWEDLFTIANWCRWSSAAIVWYSEATNQKFQFLNSYKILRNSLKTNFIHSGRVSKQNYWVQHISPEFIENSIN